MSLVGVMSPRSSPGATSLAVGLAMAFSDWDLNPLLIESDPAGGVLGHRFATEGNRDATLLSFSVDVRRGYNPTALSNNTRRIAGFDALLAPFDPTRAAQAAQRCASPVAAFAKSSARPIVVDLGRLWSGSPALELAGECDRLLIVLYPRVADVQAALFQLAAVRSFGIEPEIVMVGDQPFSSGEVNENTDAPVISVLPFAPKDAAALAGGRYKKRAFSRSPLWRAISALGAHLVNDLDHSSVAPEPPLAAEQRGEPPPPPPPAASHHDGRPTVVDAEIGDRKAEVEEAGAEDVKVEDVKLEQGDDLGTDDSDDSQEEMILWHFGSSETEAPNG